MNLHEIDLEEGETEATEYDDWQDEKYPEIMDYSMDNLQDNPMDNEGIL